MSDATKLTRTILRPFVKNKNCEWNHADWLALLAQVRAAGFTDMSDSNIGQLLEEEKKRQQKKHRWDTAGAFVRRWESEVSPAVWLVGGASGIWVIIRLVTLLMIAYLAFLAHDLLNWCTIVLFVIALFLTVDVILSNTSIAFFPKSPADFFRSAVLTLGAFLTLPIGFAALARPFANCLHPPLDFHGALVLAFDVTTRVKLASMIPKPVRWQGELFVGAMAVSQLYFVLVILRIVVSWLPKPS